MDLRESARGSSLRLVVGQRIPPIAACNKKRRPKAPFQFCAFKLSGRAGPCRASSPAGRRRVLRSRSPVRAAAGAVRCRRSRLRAWRHADGGASDRDPHWDRRRAVRRDPGSRGHEAPNGDAAPAAGDAARGVRPARPPPGLPGNLPAAVRPALSGASASRCRAGMPALHRCRTTWRCRSRPRGPCGRCGGRRIPARSAGRS